MKLLKDIFKAKNELYKQDVQPEVILMNSSDANKLKEEVFCR